MGHCARPPFPLFPAGMPTMQTATYFRSLLAVLALLLPAVRPLPAHARGDGSRPTAWHITLSGEITDARKERTLRHVRRAVGQGANLIVLELDCHGGDDQTAYQLADELIRLTEEAPAPV